MLSIEIVPVLKDNYSYLLVDKPSSSAVVIDPAEASPIQDKLDEFGLKLAEIWITHHHHDHIGGIDGLISRYGSVPVVCSERDKNRVPHASRTVREGDHVEFAGEQATVMELPGHAEGHIAFHFPKSHNLFCGDVIFGASCGAVFGGTHDEMFRSVSRVAQLPPSTRLWVGHEYTRNNLRFANAVLGSDAVKERRERFQEPSVPLLLETELATNPFMRLDTPEVQNYVHENEPAAVFKALRLAKDAF